MRPPPVKPQKTWRLWQVETSFACNLSCIMCPWTGERRHLKHQGHMQQTVWDALVPNLSQVTSVDFSGGGEPLLQPFLLDWIRNARDQGCETGFLTNGLNLSKDICQALCDVSLTWIGFSIDGADKATYEHIRKGSDFNRVCNNIRTITRMSAKSAPRTLINFVIMPHNRHQMDAIIDLACDLKIGQVNFKQCDVIRGDHGKGLGLFSAQETQETSRLKKALKAAMRRGRKKGIETEAFSFCPEEMPVCTQDPRTSLFIRYDGTVSPCINLAVGGSSTFLGQPVDLPQVTFGRLPDKSLEEIWQGEICRAFCRQLEQRVAAHDMTLARADLGHDLYRLRQAFQKAIDAMPEAPEGCRTCHYLYDV